VQALAAQTGGKLTPKIDEVMAAGDDRGFSSQALWPFFAAGALVLYLADIALRRGLLDFWRRAFARRTGGA
jgi:hypothetical protein